MNTVIMTHVPSAALLFFFAAFVWIVFRTYRPGAKSTLQSHALIPLKEEHHGQ